MSAVISVRTSFASLRSFDWPSLTLRLFDCTPQRLPALLQHLSKPFLAFSCVVFLLGLAHPLRALTPAELALPSPTGFDPDQASSSPTSSSTYLHRPSKARPQRLSQLASRALASSRRRTTARRGRKVLGRSRRTTRGTGRRSKRLLLACLYVSPSPLPFYRRADDSCWFWVFANAAG